MFSHLVHQFFFPTPQLDSHSMHLLSDMSIPIAFFCQAKLVAFAGSGHRREGEGGQRRSWGLSETPDYSTSRIASWQNHSANICRQEMMKKEPFHGSDWCCTYYLVDVMETISWKRSRSVWVVCQLKMLRFFAIFATAILALSEHCFLKRSYHHFWCGLLGRLLGNIVAGMVSSAIHWLAASTILWVHIAYAMLGLSCTLNRRAQMNDLMNN